MCTCLLKGLDRCPSVPYVPVADPSVVGVSCLISLLVGSYLVSLPTWLLFSNFWHCLSMDLGVAMSRLPVELGTVATVDVSRVCRVPRRCNVLIYLLGSPGRFAFYWLRCCGLWWLC